MSARGYPVSDFEQRAADISVDHPLVLENYRAAHETALSQVWGQASTEDLRKAMIHYRTPLRNWSASQRWRAQRERNYFLIPFIFLVQAFPYGAEPATDAAMAQE